MRRGYKCIRVRRGEAARTDVDRTVDEFAATMAYGERRYASRDAFLEHFRVDWILELHAALKDLLVKERTVLSLGSGECEHEIPFFLEGYSIVGSDVVPAAMTQTRELFPEFPARVFDLFKPDTTEQYDDVLITGLDFYFGGAQAQAVFDNVRRLLKPGGRLVFTLRYLANPVTWCIDYLGIPLICAARNVRHVLRRTGYAFTLKFHGYRRSPAEIVAMAGRAGFRLGRVRYAGFGGEWTRVEINNRFPRAYEWLRQLDRRLHWFNTATVFEFLT